MNSSEFRVFVAFGANEGDPAEVLRRAIDLLQIPLGPLQNASNLYETLALTLDGRPQSNYLNAALEFRSALPPSDILQLLLETEKALGRNRSEARRWAPRVIDLDLLFVGNRTEATHNLALPHPELHKRDFVLTPMCDIAPDFVHPVMNRSMRDLNESLEERGFERFVIGSRPLYTSQS